MTSHLPPVPQPENLREAQFEDQGFPAWVALGANRNFGALAKKLGGVPITHLIAHARKFRWNERYLAVAVRSSEIVQERLAETMADVNHRHLDKLRKMQEKAFHALENAAIDKPSDAIKLFLATLEMERKVLGMDLDTDSTSLADLLADRVKQLQSETTGKVKVQVKEPDFEFDQDALEAEIKELPDAL